MVFFVIVNPFDGIALIIDCCWFLSAFMILQETLILCPFVSKYF